MKWLIYSISFLLVSAILGGSAVLYGFFYFGRGLPEHTQLADYEPPVVTRVHAGDGRLLAEYAREKRVFVPIDAIPKRVVKAFLAAEDKNFYNHPGLDFLGLARAVVTNIKNYGTNRRPVGASTITQQVAKNFLLTNEVSIERKAKEAILSFRIEKAFTKDRILELYLNEIYLGYGSYGVAAAALNYFDKSLADLTVAEVGYLAALPKAPNNYHPIRKRAAAIERRDWVIRQMARNGFISDAEAKEAVDTPFTVRERSGSDVASAEFFAEEVRRELVDRYGEDGLYGGGLSVRTTLISSLQNIADRSLRWGLEHYDRRHGWRGPIARMNVVAGWGDALAGVEPPKGMPATWQLAVVLKIEKGQAILGYSSGDLVRLPLAEVLWARKWKENQRFGPKVRAITDVLAKGDVVPVQAINQNAKGEAYPENTVGLRQVPDVEGAVVALDPHTGRVLAMSGGYSFGSSQFNRAIQAKRQPGSAFKPFVYLAGLDDGFTPSTLILDAPFVIDQGPGLGKWKPANYTKKFYGPTPMRVGIEKSRNLMTVRLAQTIGMEKIADYSARFGIIDHLPLQLSMSLGAGETTLLRLVSGYGMLVNGGKQISPTLIDRIQDRTGRTIFRHDPRPCIDCQVMEWQGPNVPQIPDDRRQLVDPGSAFQVVSMLEGVVKRGTGRRIAKIGKPLGGKTGTTNDNVDTWFIGFSPDLAVGVFVGFDQPRTLGRRDTGSNVAAPIFKKFMEDALAESPAIPFRTPPGIRLVRVNQKTGQVARTGDKAVILEAFKPGTEPTGEAVVLDGGYTGGYTPASGTSPVAGGGSGLY